MCHESAANYVATLLLNQIPRRNVVEFGSRNVNGEIRKLFTDAYTYTGIDLVPGEGVDVVGDASVFVPDEDKIPDLVICCSVLEHTPLAQALCNNAFRILRPNGLFVVTTVTSPCPPHSGLDGGPLREGEFYQDCDPELVLYWLRTAGFKRANLQFDVFTSGDVLAVATKLV